MSTVLVCDGCGYKIESVSYLTISKKKQSFISGTTTLELESNNWSVDCHFNDDCMSKAIKE